VLGDRLPRSVQARACSRCIVAAHDVKDVRLPLAVIQVDVVSPVIFSSYHSLREIYRQNTGVYPVGARRRVTIHDKMDDT
jgi:hypothetical protein